MTDNHTQDIHTMEFETAFNALQENVAKLEGEDLPLETALMLFERGQALAKHCATLLEAAELKVRTLSSNASETPTAEE